MLDTVVDYALLHTWWLVGGVVAKTVSFGNTIVVIKKKVAISFKTVANLTANSSRLLWWERLQPDILGLERRLGNGIIASTPFITRISIIHTDDYKKE